MVTFEKKGNIDIVSFTINKINALVADEIRDKVSKLFENPNSKVIIYLKGVEYIDSSGFGCLLSLLRSARNNYGTLRISGYEPSVKTLFETLQLHTIFEICPDIDECIKTFR